MACLTPPQLLPLGLCLVLGLASEEACAKSGAESSGGKTDPFELLDQMGQALKIVEEEYYQPADQQKLLEGALRGMVAELDPHSDYFSSEDREIFEGSTSGRFGGIGVEVEFEDGEVIVIAPVEGSPADRAGIVAGDHIVALNGKPLAGERPHDVVKMMRGEIGTTLKLTIRARADSKIRDVIVTREEISVQSVSAQLLMGGVAYIRIKAFQEGTHRELLEALGSLRREQPELSGLLLDLRNNPGGLVREATAVADEFLSEGMIYSTRHRGRILKEEEAHARGAFTQGALVVLVNEFSASAAELVAGAIRDNKRGPLVGARTFGKGSVQTLLGLGYGGALKLTTALYYTPSGKTTQAEGVSPTYEVDPGYAEGPQVSVLKESDLSGHLQDKQRTNSATEPRTRGVPPTNELLHLGVARVIPKDPRGGPDRALEVAYKLVLGEPAASK